MILIDSYNGNNAAVTALGKSTGGNLTHKRGVFHTWMLEELNLSRPWDMPAMQAEDARPGALVSFSVAMHKRWGDCGCFARFYEDDFRFERIWNEPRKDRPKLSIFEGVIMPDFSTYIDSPHPFKMRNAYRNQLLGAWLQEQGLVCLPSARHQRGCDKLIEGLPERSVIVACGRALTKDVDERWRFLCDVRVTVDTLESAAVVYYGSEAYGAMDYPRSLGIPAWTFSGCNRGALDGGKSGQR